MVANTATKDKTGTTTRRAFLTVRCSMNMQMIRNDKMEGKSFLVVPMVMMVEGVHEGSMGPLYYPTAELAKFPSAWNHKPVVVYHPEDGQVTACNPIFLTTNKIGIVMNAKWEDEKLKAEAWLEVDRIEEVDQRVLNAIRAKKVLELSTGLYCDFDMIEGMWNGEEYISTAYNYRPDHLAVLPDLVGACSVKDGAGFLRLNAAAERKLPIGMVTRHKALLEAMGIHVANEMSHDDIRFELRGLVRDRGAYVYVEEVFDDYFIYVVENGDLAYYYQAYEIREDDNVGDTLTLVGVAEQVKKIVQYQRPSGDLIGNVVKDLGDSRMKKTEKLVNELIDNEASEYNEDDREALQTIPEATLKKMKADVQNKEKDANVQAVADAAAAGAAGIAKPPVTNAPTPAAAEPTKRQTIDGWINSAPAEIQDVLRNAMTQHDAAKAEAISIIKAHPKNQFTDVQLNAKPLDELKQLAAMLKSDTPAQQPAQNFEQANYLGQGTPTPTAAEPTAEDECLGVPTVNWKDGKLGEQKIA